MDKKLLVIISLLAVAMAAGVYLLLSRQGSCQTCQDNVADERPGLDNKSEANMPKQ